MKIIQMKPLGKRKTPIDFEVSRSKVKVTSTCRNRLFEQKLENSFIDFILHEKFTDKCFVVMKAPIDF